MEGCEFLYLFVSVAIRNDGYEYFMHCSLYAYFEYLHYRSKIGAVWFDGVADDNDLDKVE